MDITLESEIYTPIVNDQGIYIDKIPPIILRGIRCPCSNRKDKVYSTKQTFTSHIKTKSHAKWLDELNNSRANYFVENIKLNETIRNQQQIIAKLENEVKNKSLTIDYLTQMLTKQDKPSNTYNSLQTYDLLDMNID